MIRVSLQWMPDFVGADLLLNGVPIATVYLDAQTVKYFGKINGDVKGWVDKRRYRNLETACKAVERKLGVLTGMVKL